ncbi:helix-turn-helix domain-containing protein [Glycomyces buryatensis]|uniref:DUF5753 domain-containing protein n=1 Tax=Glycomyces buryatensis TaxID=2570927 RepID=A0A4S8QAU9_9ACTN|nr:helix-turn-helix transcriptional regulator [Glycomyces buryatensis]THV40631.1 hypothetical protein FAB82_15330 [Glycomyces buryatensis]
MNTPSLALWRIGGIMRGLREDRGYTLRQAAKILGTNKDRLDRVESAKNQRCDPGTVTGWAFKYGADEKVINDLDALAMQTLDADARGWEEVFTTTPKWFTAFLSLEAEAIAMYSYDTAYIPGLLQIRAYMEAVLAADPFRTLDEVEETIRLRLLRQDSVFSRPPGKIARMRFVLDEACLLRIRHEPWYEEQLQRLRELDALGPVEIYILPMDRGIHAGMKGAFMIMSFDGAYSPEVVYLESEYGARYIDERRAVARFREVSSITLAQVVRIEEYLSNVES